MSAVTLFVWSIWWANHEKHQAEWVTSWNQDKQEKHISNLRYVNDTTLISESEEELKSTLMSVKEESERDCLKLNIKRKKI